MKKVSTKFIVPITILLLIVALVVAVLITNSQINAVYEKVNQEIQLNSVHIRSNLDLIYSSKLEQINSSMKIYKNRTLALGAPNLNGTVKIADKVYPDLAFGSTKMGLNYAIVDRLIEEFPGSTATLFVRDGNDFVRISTNVKKSDGSRAVGTTLNKAGAAYSKNINGESFYGVVDILGEKYLTGYEPIKIKNNEVLGIWYIGYPLKALNELGEEIKKTKILNSGFCALLDASDKILFNTDGFDTTRISNIINKKAEVDEWNIILLTHEQMKIKYIFAYPQSDISAIKSKIITSTIIFTLIILLLMISILYIITNKTIVKPINILKNAANQIANGNIKVNIDYNSEDEIGQLANSFKEMINKINGMSTEVTNLVNSAKLGKLDARGNANNLSGAYRDIIIGINDTLDAIIKPLNVTAEYIDRISKGDIPPKIVEEYKGDFNEIKNNINQCIDAINLLIKDTYGLVDKATEGRLNERADASRHQGDFRRLVEGINATLDRLVGLIDNMPLPVQIVDSKNNVIYSNKKSLN